MPKPNSADGTPPDVSEVDQTTIETIGKADFFRMLIDNTSDGLLTIDESSTIVFANPAIERIFGYPPSDLIGDSLLTLIPEDLREQHLAAINRYIQTGQRNLNWDHIELPGLHKEGHQIDLSIAFREAAPQDQHFFTGIIRDITERKHHQEELERFDSIIDTVGDAIYQLDLDGNFVALNDVVVEQTGYSRDELIGESVTRILDDEDIEKSLAVIYELLTTESKKVGVVELNVHTADGDVIPVEDRIGLIRADGDVVGTVGVVRDISDRKQREKQLEQQRNELEELNRINTVIREINQTLVTATTREEIERTVCKRMAGSDSYVFAWIGGTHPSKQEIESRVWAGVNGTYLDEITITADEQDTGQGPTGKAIQSGEVHVVRNILEDPDYEPWRDQALENGFKSSAAIPIQYGDSVYGVLNLYADRAYGFTDREIEVLDELGETIGLAINAVESRKLLHADTAVELEFEITDPGSFLINATQEVTCNIELQGVVPSEENHYLYYLTIAGANPADLLELMTEAEDIQDATVITHHDEEALVLIDVAGSSAVRTLIEAGAQVKTAVAEDGAGVIIVEIAPDMDTSGIVDTVQRSFPDSALTAKREVERPIQTHREFREVVKQQLTEKQKTALEAAYQGGYFARPRNISGTDLAELFDVTPSTFHHHLQTGLNKIVGAVFDESTQT